jgi:transposase-like protein
MEEQSTTPCRKRNGRQVSFEFKIFVISQINNGQISLNHASKKYDISRSTIDYWRKKLSTFTQKNTSMNKDQEIKKLKEKLEELEFIKDFQQDLIANFEKVTGKERLKEFLPSR